MSTGEFDDLVEDLDPVSISLPTKCFMYTLEQVADMLQVRMSTFMKMIWLSGREIGNIDNSKIKAINLAQFAEPPIWRIEERDLILWMKQNGIKYNSGR